MLQRAVRDRHRQDVLAEAEKPVAERLWASVRGRTRARLRQVRRHRRRTADECGQRGHCRRRIPKRRHGD